MSAEPVTSITELQVKKDKTEYIIHKVILALDILEQFHDDVDELTLSELSKRVGMTESGLSLMLPTLISRNYIEQDKISKRYRLGYKNLELAQAVLRQTDLYRVSHPILASMIQQCGENCSVAVLRKSHVIELDSVQSDHPVQVMRRVGVHLPVHCTAAGKMLIAFESEEALELICERGGFERFTPNTLTGIDQLKEHLGRILEQGYAVDDEELDPYVRGVAAAIRDYSGRVVGAVVINGPSCRVDRKRIETELISLVRQGAREISIKLGYNEAAQPVQPKKRRPSRAKTSPAGTLL